MSALILILIRKPAVHGLRSDAGFLQRTRALCDGASRTKAKLSHSVKSLMTLGVVVFPVPASPFTPMIRLRVVRTSSGLLSEKRTAGPLNILSPYTSVGESGSVSVLGPVSRQSAIGISPLPKSVCPDATLRTRSVSGCRVSCADGVHCNRCASVRSAHEHHPVT